MSKRRKYRNRSKEEKQRIINRLFNNDIGFREQCKKQRNPLAKLQNNKNQTKLEKLQYENIKLKIENACLQK